MIKSSLLLAVAVAAGLAPLRPAGAQSLDLIQQTSLPGGAEILAFTKDGNTVASTADGGVQLYTLNADGSLTPRGLVSYAAEFGATLAAVSSVALDPLGRGFGVASLIPNANGTTAGRVAFFNYRAGSVGAIITLGVGFHPDNVSFSRDGSKVFVANEGEFTSGGATDAPGSVSVIDLSGVANLAGIAALTDAAVTTVDFQDANLATGVNLTALRFNDNTTDAIANRFRHVEPEYITEGDGKIFVTLQENNAIAELSLTGANALRWTAIRPLGTLTQTIDASDRDNGSNGPAALIDDVVKGMPMPDTVATFTSGGARFLVTANEGDFRPDDGDRVRVKDFTGTEIGVTIDRADAAFGRLRVLRDVSDPDADTLLDDMVMPGTRSFSIWDATTGALVADTGSFEPLLLTLAPTLHNINGEDSPDTFDARSPDKGPEPEALATGEVNGRSYIFVGLERQGSILMYDAQNPAAPTFVAAVNNITDGLVAPESILFLSAANSPSGTPLLLIGYEISGTIGTYQVTGAPTIPGVTAPEPTAPPTVKAKKKLRVAADATRVRLKGKASADTARVFVNGKRAQGARKWSAVVKFPAGKNKLRVRVVAFTADGTPSKPAITIVERRD